MTQPYLYLRYRSSAHADSIVVKDIDRQLIQVGSALPAEENSVANNKTFNRVVHWNNDLYCMLNDKIWKYDVANSGDWGVFYDFSGSVLVSPPAQRMGLYPCSVNGSGVLISAYPVSSTDIRFILIDTDGNVTETANKTGGGGYNSDDINWCNFGPAVAWKNRLYWIASNSTTTRVHYYDIETDTYFKQSSAGDDLVFPRNGMSNLAILNDHMYFCAKGSTGANQWWLYRFEDDGEPTPLIRVDDDVQWRATDAQAPMYSLVAITGCLYSVWLSVNPGSSFNYFYRARQILFDKSNNPTASIDVDVTLPDELKNGGTFADIGAGAQDGNMMVRVDLQTNGPTSPIYEFDYTALDDEGQSRRLYRWNGNMSTAWSFVDAGLDPFRNSYIVDIDGDSNTIWSGSGTLNTSAPRLSVAGRTIKCVFKIFGGANQPTVNAEILFNKDGETLSSKGTILSSSHGVVVGNINQGLVADGLTEYTIVWDAAVDGVLTNDNPKVAIRVFT